MEEEQETEDDDDDEEENEEDADYKDYIRITRIMEKKMGVWGLGLRDYREV